MFAVIKYDSLCKNSERIGQKNVSGTNNHSRLEDVSIYGFPGKAKLFQVFKRHSIFIRFSENSLYVCMTLKCIPSV